MERALVPDRENLIAELSSWNQQENQFRSLFSEQALQDRSFMKMKLAEYNRLWYKYGEQGQTTDEKALLMMLRFQRRKMEKTLYPGLLTRLLVRSVSRVRGALQQRQAAAQRQPPPPQYVFSDIPASSPDGDGQQNSSSQQASTHVHHRKQYGYDLGRRQKNRQGQRKGPSL